MLAKVKLITNVQSKLIDDLNCKVIYNVFCYLTFMMMKVGHVMAEVEVS